MRWLRREKDWLGLVLAWALFAQSFILGFASTLHAAEALARGGTGVICSAKGTAGPQAPGPAGQKSDCPCCVAACRTACHMAAAGLPGGCAIPLPGFAVLGDGQLHDDALLRATAERFAVRPRAPPLA
jgi:hypothetical protein